MTRWTTGTDGTVAGRVVPRAVAVLLLALMAGIPLRAQAQPTPQEKATAEALFRDARTLMTQKHYSEACRKFEESQRLDPQGGTLLNLAICHESEGRVASAWVEFQEALALATSTKHYERQRIASQHLKGLGKRVPHLTIEVGRDAMADGLHVERNATAVGPAAWGSAIAVDPGEQEIAVTAPGHKPWHLTVKIEEGDDKTVVLPALAEDKKATPPAEVPVDLQRLDQSRRTTRKTWGWVAGGAGLAAIGVGSYFGFRAIRQSNESDAHCNGTFCDPTGVARNDDANRAAWMSNGFVGAGLIGVAAGTWLLLSHGSDNTTESTPTRTQARVSPVAGPQGAAIVVDGTW